ncbi:MAG: hypothetical protein Q4B54_06200 [Coriobacteriales bacterium]|nr:hypothetical protein [Coriobacteriales bacterium]
MGSYVLSKHEGSDRVKRYVAVVANTNVDGIVTPLTIIWEDGRHFDVDKVIERRQAHSLKTGGSGMRYTVRVGGHTTYLWFDDYRGRWFVEAKREG